jgi:CAAX protease family protein
MKERRDIGRRVLAFLGITFGLSAVFDALLIATGTIGGRSSLLALALMWTPAASALITIRLFGDDWRTLGWRPGRARYLAVAYLLPVVYGAATYGIVWMAGRGDFTGDWPPHLLVFVVIGTIAGAVSALGEELGWRGYLVPRLAAAYGFTPAALGSGLIWAIWHYPILLFTDYGIGSPRWYTLACFTVAIVGLSFAFAWLRLASGSVWPAVLLHTSHNLFLLHVFTPLMDERRTAYMLTGEGGLLLAIAGLIVGGAFWALRHHLPDTGAGVAQGIGHAGTTATGHRLEAVAPASSR